MLRGVKNAVMTAAIGAAECVFSLAGRHALHNVGERFIRTSGLGMGALPVAFRPEEVEYFAEGAGARFDAIRDYEAALTASGSEETDNFAKRGRFLMLHQLAHLAFDRHGAAGDLAECGCWRGQSTYMLAAIARQRGASGFHVFDSFEGLSEYGEQDRGGLAPADRQAADARRRHFAADIEAVRATLAPFGFVQLHKGWIPERFPAVADRQFKIVHIDVDLYRPYVDSIEFFYPRLLDGGVMIFDDYGSAGFPGARKAVDEMLQRFRPSVSLYFPLGGSAWIK